MDLNKEGREESYPIRDRENRQHIGAHYQHVNT